MRGGSNIIWVTPYFAYESGYVMSGSPRSKMIPNPALLIVIRTWET